MQDTHHLNLVGGSLATAPTLGLAPPGYEIPPLRGWLKPLQDPTPVKRARTVTRMPGVLNHAVRSVRDPSKRRESCPASRSLARRMRYAPPPRYVVRTGRDESPTRERASVMVPTISFMRR